jgi:hypothetical protein
MSKAVVSAALFLAVAAYPQSQNTGAQLTARELFYAAAETPAAKPAAAKPATAKPRTPAKPAKPASRQEDAARRTPKASAPAEPRRPLDNGGTQYVPASLTAEHPGTPLGLRYTILKLIDGRMTEVAPDTVFHAGDRIQVSIESNAAGFLYIVHQGTSGTWKPLFPSPEIEEGSNRIEKGRTYVMPPKSRFYFDEQAGEEKLFIVFSRQPEPDLENLIYKLQEGGKPATPASPAPEPATRRPAPVLLAANLQIDDNVVGRLRNVYARDLVVEKVDDSAPAPGGRMEKAVYVVNPNGAADARVVADVRLTHR